MSQEDLAEALGWEVQAIKRREAGKQEPKRAELIAIAAICKVPLGFLERGFGEAPAPAEATPTALDEVRDELRAMKGRLLALEAAGLPPSEKEPGTTGDLQAGQQR